MWPLMYCKKGKRGKHEIVGLKGEERKKGPVARGQCKKNQGRKKNGGVHVGETSSIYGQHKEQSVGPCGGNKGHQKMKDP